MIKVDDLGFGFPTFPQFQSMLRDYEADLARYKELEREADVARDAYFAATAAAEELAALKRADVARDMYLSGLALTQEQIASLANQAGGQFVPDATNRGYKFSDRRRESLAQEQRKIADNHRGTPS